MHFRLLTLLISIGLLSSCSAPAEPNETSTTSLDISAKELESSISLLEVWMEANLREKGLFRYIYDVDNDSYPNKNNAIRQLMAARLLAELSQKNDKWLPMHRKNLDFLFTNWYREDDDLGYIFYDGKSKLGANAMVLRTLVASPLFPEYEEQAKRLSAGILSLINPDGSFDPWFIEPSYAYDADYLLTFYSGEAILSLAEYYKKVGDEEILSAAVRTQDFYIQRYVDEMDQNYYPAYVPWHTQSLSALYSINKDEQYLDAIFALNDKLLEILDTETYIGRFYNPETPQYGTPHSSSDGVYTEGLAYAYETALRTGDTDHQHLYAHTLALAVLNLRALQYNKNEVSNVKNPERLLGAIRISAKNPDVRIDTVQHTMDALRKIQNLMSSMSE